MIIHNLQALELVHNRAHDRSGIGVTEKDGKKGVLVSDTPFFQNVQAVVLWCGAMTCSEDGVYAVE
jgi:hypothetical protein